MRRIALWVAALLAGGAAADDPLTRPITGADAARWLEPDKPARVFGTTSYLGPRRVKQVTIDTGHGLVLIDAGLPEGLPALRAQLATLGQSLAKVKWVLVSEPHYDHAGALAAVVRESGAVVYASASTSQALANGISGDDDPQRASLLAYAPVRGVRVVADGTRLLLGGVTITARVMPGHTPGSMGWSWQACEGANCARVLFAASLNSLTAGTYRYADHPALVADFRRSIAMLGAEPCDILLSNHAEHSGADLRLAKFLAGAKPNPMRDPGACRAMAQRYGQALDAELARERAPIVDRDGTVHADGIRVPQSSFVSAQGRELQAVRLNTPFPSLTGDWLARVRAATDENQLAIAEKWRAIFPVQIRAETIGGVATDVVTPANGVAPGNRNRVLINLHGGGFFAGAHSGGLAESVPVAGRGAITVVAVNYRLGPEHRFPAASEDVEQVYRALLKRYKPDSIGLYGCSAGGALVAQSIARFQQRKLPMPGAIGLFCSGAIAPFFARGDSAAFTPMMNGQAQPGAEQMENGNPANPYLAGADRHDPLLSPGDYPAVLAKFPPTLLLSGTRDVALSNLLVTNARLLAAGVGTRLFVQEGMGHQEFNNSAGTPEARQAHDVIWKFFDETLSR